MQHGLVHVSAGDLLRAEVKAGTPAGKRAQEFMDNGNLVPNDVVVEMVVNRLQQEDAQKQGWLLDGYPRSEEQVEAIEAAGIRPDVFILINVSSLLHHSKNTNILKILSCCEYFYIDEACFSKESS